jgi:hypothetical protein
MFNGIIHHHGIQEGGPGIHQDPTHSDYDDCICNAMAHTQFLQLKWMLKLNKNFLAPKPNQPKIPSCIQYDMITKQPIFKINWVTKKMGLKQYCDETTYLGLCLVDMENLIADLCIIS